MRCRFYAWWNYGYNNAFRFDKDQEDSVGLGGNISKSLDALVPHQRPPPMFTPDDGAEDAGNGSLMRLAAVPIYFHENVNTAIAAAKTQSFTTHPGPLAAEACGFLTFAIVRALHWKWPEEKPNAKAFLNHVTKEYCAILATCDDKASKTMCRLLASNEAESSTERSWNWRNQSLQIMNTMRVRGEYYNGYPVSAEYYGSFSLDGLASALHAIYFTDSFSTAIEAAVNRLGDADTVGAITGQLAGALYGSRSIDSQLVEQLNKWDRGEFALRAVLLTSAAKMSSAH